MITNPEKTAPFCISTVWQQDGRVLLLDQTLLPTQEKVIEIPTVELMWDAIKKLRVRGAPAIGVAAGYGVYIGARNAVSAGENAAEAALATCDYLETSRPTAVNLFWALDRMRDLIARSGDLACPALRDRILEEAEAIRTEDLESGRSIGRFGAALINDGDCILTHCNAGALATAGYGTALAPMFRAMEDGKNITVYADETRPLLQGARLTAWELKKAGIPVTLICDNMAASVMAAGRINKIIVGADRIASNGDFANKIGTYGLAVLAKHHGIPFYVAAPWSTVDENLADGSGIPIEQRDPAEITQWGDYVTAPAEIGVFNPAFDVTPAELVTGYITDRGYFERLPGAAR